MKFGSKIKSILGKNVLFFSNFAKLWHSNMAQNEQKIRSIVGKKCVDFSSKIFANCGIATWEKNSAKN